MKKLITIWLLALVGTAACSADRDEAPPASAGATITNEDDAAIRERLSGQMEGIDPSDLRASPIPGLYEISKGTSVGYITTDGRYLIEGDLLDMHTETNLTEQRRSTWRRDRVAALDDDSMIVFAPKNYEHTVTIFTDIDCGYCRKLHAEIDGYLNEGIRVRYVFYPLRGEKAPSYGKAEAVWCSKDRHHALTQAKRGKDVKAEACETPVEQHLQAGIEMGLRGTPGIITESGELLPGYMPPKALRAALDEMP